MQHVIADSTRAISALRWCSCKLYLMHFYSCAEMTLICQAVQLQLVVFSFHQLAPGTCNGDVIPVAHIYLCGQEHISTLYKLHGGVLPK